MATEILRLRDLRQDAPYELSRQAVERARPTIVRPGLPTGVPGRPFPFGSGPACPRER